MPSQGRGDATHLWPAVVVLSYIFVAPYMLHVLLLRKRQGLWFYLSQPNLA